jgi:hypothetical protein
MKISIGINGFKKYEDLEKREKFCLESLKICQQKQSKFNINLFLIKNKKDDITYEGFKTINIQHDTKYPFVNDILNVLSETDCDLFCFLNSDIVLNTNFFNYLDNKYDTYAASRAHLYELNSLNEPLKIEGYSVHGFDLFAFKKDWWLKNKSIFPDMYLGRSYWDTVYFTKCATKSNILIMNKLPPVIYHPEHHSTAAHDKDKYNTHNENIAKNYPDMNKWWYYVYNVLLKRPTVNNIKWWQPHENELQLEELIFKNEN